MISLQYFSVQKLSFALLGIDIKTRDSKSPQRLIKHPLLLYGLLLCAIVHSILISHYAYVQFADFMEITDCVPVLCQLVLSLSKISIFLIKRTEVLSLTREVHKINYKAQDGEMPIVQRENAKDNFLGTIFFRMVMASAITSAMHPLLYGLYVYFTSHDIVLVKPFKSSVFWDETNLAGYSVIYLINISTCYLGAFAASAFDTLFFWLVSNIVAQFHIIAHRFEKLAEQHSQLVFNSCQKQLYKKITSGIQYHRQTLYLAQQINHVYGEIIFIKVLILCTEICSIVFQIGRPSDSLADLVYRIVFLLALSVQLLLYSWNGQRIKDESFQVSTAIYCAIDWSGLPKSCKKQLLILMVRAQQCCRVTGVFFEVDLNLFLWVFKTASSLLAAIKTLEENQA